MRYSDITAGMYIIRTRELRWLGAILGEICYVDFASSEELRLRITEDCVPKGTVYSVGIEADDGNWRCVGDLVMDANACIAPSLNTCAFTTAVSANYRNFLELGDKVAPLDLDSAVGNICLLGERTDNGTVFSKTGYYIISRDDAGYVIAYQGYCEYKDDDEPRVLKLRILNLNGTKRNFYPASSVVSACEAAYTEDCQRAEEYINRIKEDTIVSSADSLLAARHNSGVSEMTLEASLC